MLQLAEGSAAQLQELSKSQERALRLADFPPLLLAAGQRVLGSHPLLALQRFDASVPRSVQAAVLLCSSLLGWVTAGYAYVLWARAPARLLPALSAFQLLQLAKADGTQQDSLGEIGFMT